MTMFEFLKNFKETPPKKKLKLPKKFVRLFGETLSDVVFLKPTFGLSWEIGLTKTDGKVWLNYGWPEFTKHFALDRGRFLFFRYEGNSEFGVSICDNRKSTSKIYCSPDPARRDEAEAEAGVRAKVHGRKGSFDNVIEISDSLSLPSFDDEVESRSPSKRKKTRANDRHEESIPMFSVSNEDDSVASNSEIEDTAKILAYRKLCDRSEKGAAKKKGVVRRKAAKVHERTPNAKDDSGKSGEPDFVVYMTKSSVTYNYHLHFPMQFWRKYLNCRVGDVVLHRSDGISWTVKIHVDKRSNASPKPAFTGRYWKKFVQDNNLAAGDACRFELIDRDNISFNVTISRENPRDGKTANKAHGVISDSEASGDEFKRLYSDLGEKSSSTEPFFRTTVCKSVYYLRVPRQFGLAHFGKNKQTVTLEVGERSWPVRVIFGQERCFFCRGFNVFHRDNSLHIGDVCIFKLIEKGNTKVLQVTISRA